MRSRSLAAICVVAAFATSAVASTAASAEPEFVTKAAIGETVNTVQFTGTVGASFWERASNSKVTCTTGTVTGEVTGAQSIARTVFVLHGCETSGCQFNTAGKPAGVMETKVLAGKLGGLTSSLPGIKLFSEAERNGEIFMEGETCGVLHGVWRGEVTGAISGAAGEDAATGKLAGFRLLLAEKSGVQKYQGFSEGPEAGLPGQLESSFDGGTPEPTGWSATATIKSIPSTLGLGITK